jgi:predicted GIY-YIG superfamily endonuclease
VIQSLTTGKFYIGATADLPRRLDRHAQGTTAYTRAERPWTLVGYEVHATMREARARERLLKRNPRMRFFFIKRALAGPTGSLIAAPRSRQVMG